MEYWANLNLVIPYTITARVMTVLMCSDCLDESTSINHSYPSILKCDSECADMVNTHLQLNYYSGMHIPMTFVGT